MCRAICWKELVVVAVRNPKLNIESVTLFIDRGRDDIFSVGRGREFSVVIVVVERLYSGGGDIFNRADLEAVEERVSSDGFVNGVPGYPRNENFYNVVQFLTSLSVYIDSIT